MIQVNPLNRISISDALKHSFFDKWLCQMSIIKSWNICIGSFTYFTSSVFMREPSIPSKYSNYLLDQ
jgi:hypothetical protein